nr:MAG: Ku protein [Pseudomonadota bacterium]
MSPRAMWKGRIRLDGFELPVKLYSAATDRAVHFRLLHAPDRVPLEQRMVDPVTNEPVAYQETRRGLELDSGTLVVLERAEIDGLAPAPTRDIEVLGFLAPERVPRRFTARPYFLGPDGDAPAYFAFAEALASEHKQCLVHWVMRKTEYIGSIREFEGYLGLVTLRHAEELVDIAGLAPPVTRELTEKELTMAEQLVGMFEGAFDPTQFRDEYRDRVAALVEAKAKGKKLAKPRVTRPEPERSLSAALEASLKRARERKVA